jgi:putative DNA primase/helicase
MSSRGTNSPVDFEGINKRLLSNAKVLLTQWLPNGKFQGREYVLGGLAGEAGTSLSINWHTGVWMDYATNESGSDLISLYAAIHGFKQIEAARELDGTTIGELEPRPVKTEEITLPPDGAEPPAMVHYLYGEPEMSWRYDDIDGNHVYYVGRYRNKEGRKQVVPWSWSNTSKKWVNRAFPKLRPVYGLPQLAKYPKHPVLITEGEKDCDAAHKIVNGDAFRYICMTWSGGGKAVKMADLEPLRGRSILLWTDGDRHVAKTETEAHKTGVNIGEIIPWGLQPGTVTMRTLAAELTKIDCTVKTLNPGINQNKPDGWGAADVSDWTWETFKPWAKKHVEVFTGADVINLDIEVAKRKDPAAAPPASMLEKWHALGLTMKSHGKPNANEDNVCRILEDHPSFKDMLHYDEFHRQFFVVKNGKREQLEDSFIDSFTLQLQRDFGIPDMKVNTVKKAIAIHARKTVKNEPKDYFESLDPWDKTPRIEFVLTDLFGAAGTEYIRAVSSNFFKMIVARVLSPGCKVDNIIVLKGPQGQFKSTAFEMLMGEGMYMSVTAQVTNKDFYMDLQGKLLCEVAELDSFTQAEANKVKQVLSTRIDRFRVPYASVSQDHPRQGIFVGSTNENAFLKDHTGNRRYWIVRCDGTVNKEGLVEQRDQLFAEALYYIKLGELGKNRKPGTTWWEVPLGDAAIVADDYREVDVWENTIAEALVGITQVAMEDLLEHELGIKKDKQTLNHQWRVGRIMDLLGWERHKIREGKKTKRIWRKIDAETEELNLDVITQADLKL